MGGMIYEGEVGTVIDIDIRTDISGATNVSLLIKKPDRSTVVWLPTVVGTQILRYTTVSGDLIVGLTEIQPKLTLGSWSGKGRSVFIQVFRPLPG